MTEPLAEVRGDNGRFWVSGTPAGPCHCTCRGSARLGPTQQLPGNFCRHINAYRRAVVIGSNIIVRDATGPLFVILNKAATIDPDLVDAYELALDLLKGASAPALHHAAVKIRAFAQAHGFNIAPARDAGKTRRILIVDTDGE